MKIIMQANEFYDVTGGENVRPRSLETREAISSLLNKMKRIKHKLVLDLQRQMHTTELLGAEMEQKTEPKSC